MEKNEKNEAAQSGKTVIVVDEQGTNYGATWPRRAKSLVKNGRARFISENTICLACPPDKEYLEDTIMSDKTETKIPEEVKSNETNSAKFIAEIASEMKNVNEKKAAEAEKKNAKLNVEWFFSGVSLSEILNLLNVIATSNGHITDIANAIIEAVNSDKGLSDSQMENMNAIVADRECTNREIIKMLNRIYSEFVEQLHS